MEELKYFFSYSRKDSDFVLRLAKELRAAGVNLWLDQLDLLGGQLWDETIEKTLKSCKGVIAILSPESVDSRNVKNEWEYALQNGKSVVPARIGPCEIPLCLERVHYIDFTEDYDAGFSQLLRALGTEQAVQPLESVAAQESVVEGSTAPVEAKPTELLAPEEQAAQEVEEPTPQRESEPRPDEVDHPKPAGLETEKSERKRRVAKILSAICVIALMAIILTGIFLKSCQPKNYGLTATAGPNGAIDPNGTARVAYGGTREFKALPNTGYQVDTWFVDDNVVQTGGTSYTLGNIQADHAVRVTFSPLTFEVTSVAGPNGAIDPDGTVLVAYDGTQEFKALPNTGYQVDTWFVDGNAVQTGQSDYTLGNIQANHAVNVTFRPLTFEVTSAADANGAIDPNGTAQVVYDGTRQFEALPNAGCQVDTWSVDGNAVQTGGTDYALLNIQADHTVRVTFRAMTFEIASIADSNGAIDPNGTAQVVYDGNREFKALPKTGHQVDRWFVDDNVVQTGGTSYTLRNIQADHAVKVTFRPLTFEVTSEVTSAAGPGGSITPSGATPVHHGDDLAFNATSKAGYQVDTWSVDGNAVQTGGTDYALLNIQADHTVRVTFSPLTFEVTSVAGPNGAIDPNGTAQVAYDGTLEFKALPSTGHQVHRWSVDGNDVQSGGTDYALLNIQADHTVRVTFSPLTFEVASVAGPNGAIDPNGTARVVYDGTRQFTALPNTGYQVDTWFVDDNADQTGGTDYTLRNVQADHSVRVTFRQPPVVNQRPVANDDDVKVGKSGRLNIDVTANDTDSDGTIDRNTVKIVAKPAHGDAVVRRDGTVDYTHDRSEASSDSFTYTVDDKDGATSKTAKVTITVQYPKRPVLPFCRRSPYQQGSVSESMLPYLLFLGAWIIIKRRGASRRNAINKCAHPGGTDSQK